MSQKEEQKIIEVLDRIISKSNDIDNKLQQILDALEKPTIKKVEKIANSKD